VYVEGSEVMARTVVFVRNPREMAELLKDIEAKLLRLENFNVRCIENQVAIEDVTNNCINCDDCGKDIGSETEPIFVANDGESILCRACCTELDGEPPSEDRAEYIEEEKE
jgi:hypothetical protein